MNSQDVERKFYHTGKVILMLITIIKI